MSASSLRELETRVVTSEGYRKKFGVTVEQRQLLTAQLYLSGVASCTRIADYLNERGVKTSKDTVLRDLQEVRADWRTEATRSVGERIERELAKLDLLEQRATDGLTALEVELMERGDEGELKPAGVKALVNKTSEYIHAMLSIAKRRARLLGLDQAVKIQVEERRPAELTDEELEAAIREGRAEGKPDGDQ